MTTLTQLSAKAPAATQPEIELLLCCARTHIDTAIAERIENLLQQDIDWAYLIQKAAHHGVMPLLYKSLNTTCPEAVPKAILAQLRDYFHTNAQHNWLLTKELLLLLNLFEAHGIPAIPYKGPALAALAYGNLALRQFSDLDILVHSRDDLRAKDLLISEGYQLYNDLGWEHHFWHEDTRVNVDLHHEISPRCLRLPLDFERLWSRLEPVSIAGTTVSNLMPEDWLPILYVEWAKDCYERRERLAQLVDVAELLRVHPRLDWVRILEQACTLGSERMLLLDLFLANGLLGAALPEAVLNRLQANPVVKLLAQQVRSHLWRKADDLPRDRDLLGILEEETYLFHLRMIRERLPDRVTYCFYWQSDCLRFAFTPNERDRVLLPLPRVLSFLYYPLRLIRLTGKHGLGLLRRFSGF